MRLVGFVWCIERVAGVGGVQLEHQFIHLGCPRAAGDQHMQVRMPVQELAVRLNRPDHAGYDIVAHQQPPGFRLQTRPDTGREFTQQLVIEARVHSQTFGDGQHDLPMSDRRADFFGNVQRGQQRPLLMARGYVHRCLQEKTIRPYGVRISCQTFAQI